MLFKADTLQKVVSEKPRGGVGEVTCNYAFQMDKGPEASAFRAMASQYLMPGNSIGYHQHTENEEVYVILSGEGTYYDNDSEKGVAIAAGDMTLTPKGEFHALVNTGTEPLHFLAIIAKN